MYRVLELMMKYLNQAVQYEDDVEHIVIPNDTLQLINNFRVIY